MDDKLILDLIKDKRTRERGYRLLINQTKEKMYWQIRRMVLSHNDTDDLIQEVYIKVFKHINHFHGNSCLSTWIYRISYNETINFLKSKENKKHQKNISLENNMIDSLTEDSLFDANEINIKFEKAILSLPSKQRAVFQMRYYEDIPFKEMEKITNTSESALKTSYHIAEKKIKDIMLEDNNEK
ncbi:MAG: sigma-70 family RNA polymerase sigma factor [Bacteroidales bacterium]|jgi:RNA polymerase sigma-70 factor (ECF subfamily)|nr:sigma-70 family RNA polymerase sigma factor [Bacteroidales bacterium]